MKLNLVGPFVVNAPFGTEIAFAKGLRQLGFVDGESLFCVDPNVDIGMQGLCRHATATIVFKSCVGQESVLASMDVPVIVYQPDDARFPHIRQMMLMMRKYSDLFLSFDQHGADVALSMGYRAAEELLLTADPELYSPSPTHIERDIDVSFIGSLGDPVAHASRRRMIHIIDEEASRRGWKTFFGQTQDIPTVVDVYRRSKVVLNHATDVGQGFGWGYGIQCRHFEVGMTQTSLLTNYTFGGDGVVTHFGSCFGHEDTLVERTRQFIESDDPSVRGRMTLDLIRERHMPIHRAGQIINFVQRHVIG